MIPFTKDLITWFIQSQREMPWRQERSPWRTFVSEIMLQQTRVDTVIPYFNAFMEKFPSPAHLASADEQEVLKAWQGLGYYSRARNLQKAAKCMVERHDGQVPSNEKLLLQLPGIGPYTLGAISSIAFDKPVAAVDGNVLRVMARVHNDDRDIALSSTRDSFTQYVYAAMPKAQVGDFTEALMELGALICLPKNPDCLHCPVKAHCEGFSAGRVQNLPQKSPKDKPVALGMVVLLCTYQNRIWVRKRPMKGLLSGLWEFPNTPTLSEAMAMAEEMGLSIGQIEEIGSAKHIFTHRVWQMQGLLCHVEIMHPQADMVWVDRIGLLSLPMPSAMRHWLNIALQNLT